MMCYVPDTRHLFSRGWGSKDFTVYRYIGKSIDEFCILCEENVIFFSKHYTSFSISYFALSRKLGNRQKIKSIWARALLHNLPPKKKINKIDLV